MTCASCANRIERRLNRLDGVTATVNFATEKAAVDFDPREARPEDLLDAISAVGYRAALPRDAAERDEHGRGGRGGRAAPAPAHLRGPVAAGAADGDGAGAAVRQLAVAQPRAREPGRDLGRLAVPPGGVRERAARRRDDGHADLRRRARGLAVVGLRAVPRRGRDGGHADAVRARARARLRDGRDLLRGRLRRHDAHPARPLLRGARQAQRRRRAARPARAGRQGRQRAGRRRRGAPDPGRAARGRAAVRRAAGGEGRDRRGGRERAPPRST